MPAFVLHSLGFEVAHVLARIGATCDPAGDCNPLVNCLFVPAPPELSSPVSARASCVRQLPLGQLSGLRIADEIHPDGRVTTYRGVNLFTTRIRVGPQVSHSKERACLVREGLLPLRAFDAGPDEAGTGQSYWHVVPGISGDVDVVLIPAFLLFSSYFAPNSRLALSFFDGSVLDIIREIEENVEGNRKSADGSCYLSLSRGRLVSDALPLGRARFDASGYALKTTQAIANAILLARRGERPFTFDCDFPFIGETTLTFRGVEYIEPRTQRRVQCVLEILGCSHPLPWTELHVDIDQASKTGDPSAASPAKNGGARFEDFGDDFLRLDPDVPRPQSTEVLIARTRSSVAFSNPGPGTIHVTRRESNSAATSGTGRKGRERKQTTAKKAGAGGDNATQRTELIPQDDSPPSTTHKDESFLSPVAALQSIAQALDEMEQQDGVAIEFVRLSPVLLRYGNLDVNQIPEKPEATSRAWQTIRQGQQRRCVLIARLSLLGKHLHLFEILRNPNESFSTLIAYRPDGTSIVDADLQRLFDEILLRGGLPPDEVLSKAASAKVQRVRHASPREGRFSGASLRRSSFELLDRLQR